VILVGLLSVLNFVIYGKGNRVFPTASTVRDKRWRREGSAYYRNFILFFGKHSAPFHPLDLLVSYIYLNFSKKFSKASPGASISDVIMLMPH
jgi:hypothetical protein